MNSIATIVTAFFDIGRETRGDGRSIAEYKEWIKKTLQLNCHLFVVTEEKFKDLFIQNRPPGYSMHIQVIDFKESHYYQYYEEMKSILENNEYKQRIMHPDRVECKLPEYNILQYSKLHYLQMAIELNPFQSEYFLWMDAGASRFFYDMNVHNTYPSPQGIEILKQSENKLIIQSRWDISSYPIDDDFIWKSDNLLIGGMFGGNIQIINTISNKIEEIVIHKMLKKRNINNEQLALAMIWKKHNDLFLLINGNHTHALFVLPVLAM
jgi:hypothetical protein